VDDEDLIQLRVADVKVAVPAGNGVEAGLVVLEEEDHPYRTLRMFIGQAEARAIHVPWSNTIPPRPSTWDLFVSTIAILDGRIDRVVITDVEELRHYFAQVVMYQGQAEDPIIITARPSDALALALRAYGAKMYARARVLDEAGVLADGTRWVPPTPEPSPEETGETEETGESPDPVAAPPEVVGEARVEPPIDPEGAEPANEVAPTGDRPADLIVEPGAEVPPLVHAAQEPAVPVVDTERGVVAEPAVVAQTLPEPPAIDASADFPVAGPAEAKEPSGKKGKKKSEKDKNEKDKKKKKAGKKHDAG
jgi:bifunctional DNase/RNase